MRILFVLTLLLAVMSTPVLAEWVRAGEGDTDNFADVADNYDYYVDPAKIRRKGNIVKMWTLTDTKAPVVWYFKTFRGVENFRSVKILWEHDCAEEKARTLAVTKYSERMGKGSVVRSFNYPDAEWQPVSPDSVGKTLWEIACGKRKLKPEVLLEPSPLKLEPFPSKLVEPFLREDFKPEPYIFKGLD